MFIEPMKMAKLIIRLGLVILVLGTISIIIGAKGCPWSKDDDDKAIVSGSSVPQSPTEFTTMAVALGSNHSLALASDPPQAGGTVWAWGRNNKGQLGLGTTTDCLIPTLINSLNNVTSLAASDLHSLALLADGTVLAWGSNEYGQLGNGTDEDCYTPVAVSALTNVITLTAGAYHSLALTLDGKVWTWGYNCYGQLGDETNLNRSIPVTVSGLTGITVTAIAGGAYHNLALLSDGTIRAWGFNEYGQLGDETTVDSATPIVVSGLMGVTVTGIAAGWHHSLALLEDGTVRAWGWNFYGQLGDGTTIDSATPITVSGLTNVTGLAAGYAHSLALLFDQSVVAWGSNDSGQIGDGTKLTRVNFVPLSGLTNVIALAAGWSHSLALLSDGTFKTWGANACGQLGNGTIIPRLGPVEIDGLPKPPTNLEATTLSSFEIELTWTGNADNNADGFKIERKAAANDTYALINTVDTISGTTSYFYSDDTTELPEGNTYYYRIRAYNAVGNSAYSNEAGATTLFAIPNKPTNLQATPVSRSRIDLTWDDNSDNETGFKIERKKEGEAEYTQMAVTSFSSYPDIGLSFSTEYFYRVCAYNPAGDSDYAEAFATTSADDPPVLTAIGNKSTDENVKLEFTISATDPDGDPITYSASGLPTGASFDPSTQVFIWTPGYDQADFYPVTFTATANGLSDSEMITITVNNVDRAPVLAAIGAKSTDENMELAFSISATDPDTGDTITYSMDPVLNGASLNSTTGAFTWIPDYAQAGSYPVTFTATANSLSDSEMITITVNNVEQPPVLNAIGDKGVNEGELLNFTVSVSDPDLDPITYSIDPIPSGASLGSSSGIFNWTPDFTQAGAYVVTFTATANTLSDSETITITVNNVDAPPELVLPGDKGVDEGATLNFTLDATDPDSDPITYTIASSPVATGASLDSATGAFSWTPGYDQAGSYSVTFTASSGMPVLSDYEVITITVNNVDRPPVLTAIGDKSTDEGVELVFGISATDPDTGETIFYSMEPTPTGASLNTTTGAFSWTPDYDQAGVYPVTFTATSGPTPLSDYEAITITVSDIDRPPVLDAIGDKSTDENIELAFGISASDPDTEPITYTMESSPDTTGAVLNSSSGAFSWIPTYDQAGSYSVTFTVSSGMPVLSDYEVITITVNDVPQTPAAPALSSVVDNPMWGLKLTWTDNSDNETKFYIDRRVDGGDWEVDWQSVGENIKTYTDTTAIDELKYYEYRIRAWNAAGYSNYSNTKGRWGYNEML